MKNIKLFEDFGNDIQAGKIYVTTGEINGENQNFPHDFDFEIDVKLIVTSVDHDTVIAEEAEPADSDNEDVWAFDLEEFKANTKILGR